MALDFGEERTGVAVGDPTGTIVRPLEPVLKAATSDGMASIAEIVAQNGVGHVVIGLPTGLQGETRQTAKTRSFAGRLRTVLTVPVSLYDERYTSQMADQTTATTGSTTARDSLAACHLLTSWLESNSR
jgi:putative holliday junction resolvase